MRGPKSPGNGTQLSLIRHPPLPFRSFVAHELFVLLEITGMAARAGLNKNNSGEEIAIAGTVSES